MNDAEDIVIRWINAHFPIGKSTSTYWSATHEPYVVLGEGGIKIEGEAHDPAYIAGSESAAIRAVKRAFKSYIKDKPTDSSIYWRSEPELFYRDDGRIHFFVRLLVSDKSDSPTGDDSN